MFGRFRAYLNRSADIAIIDVCAIGCFAALIGAVAPLGLSRAIEFLTNALFKASYPQQWLNDALVLLFVPSVFAAILVFALAYCYAIPLAVYHIVRLINRAG